MASVAGGQFHFGADKAPGSRAGSTAGHLSLASVVDYHETVKGSGGSGFDSVAGPSSGELAGQAGGGAGDNIVSTHTAGGNTLIHLPDGSSLTVLGSTHLDGSFFH